MAMKRSGKFYRKNEKEVMEQLGFVPTPNSGSGWVVKEDGQNDNMICQLKSTDALSINIKLADIEKLQYNSSVSHKIPVFVIQFLRTNDVFLLVSPDNIEEVATYIKTGQKFDSHYIFGPLEQTEDILSANCAAPKIKSSNSARDSIRQEIQNKYKKKTRSAK